MKTKIIAMLALAITSAAAARAETYKLVGDRYLRRYTAAGPTQAYNASVDAATVVRELCNVPWGHSSSTQAVATAHTEATLDSNIANRENFDAALFCANHTNGTHVVYANAAVYRYALPDGTLPALTRLAVRVMTDPYNALGARIVLMTNSTGEIPTDCATVRGDVTGGIKATNVAPRITREVSGKNYWYPNDTNLVFTTAQLGASGLQLQKYLFVFVLMENYSTTRGNWFEGCAYIENKISITTSSAVPGWTDGSMVDLVVREDPEESETPTEIDEDDVTNATLSPWYGKMAAFEQDMTVIKCATGSGGIRYFAAPPVAYRHLHRGDTNLASVTHSAFKYRSGWALGPATNLLGVASLTVRSVYPHKPVKVIHGAVRLLRGYEFNPPLCDFTDFDRSLVDDYAKAFGLATNLSQIVGSVSTNTSASEGWLLYCSATSTADTDGDGLDLVHEWDNGILPTDPNSKDTDGDTVMDSYELYYHLKGGDAALDFDGDGLSNYAEYLISEVFQVVRLDPDNPKTDGSCVDYFRKMGDLYLGEIFTDHDGVNDFWEDEYADEAAVYDNKPFADCSVYDPSRDADNDGWSNWAEAMAGTDPTKIYSVGTNGIPKAEYPVPVIEAHVVYNGRLSVIDAPLVFKAWNEATDADMVNHPDAVWTVPSSRMQRFVYGTHRLGVADSDSSSTNNVSRGYVREGATKFVVFADQDGDGEYTAGEPFGFVHSVDVGWQGASFNVDLTDTHPVFARIFFANSGSKLAGSNDRSYWQEQEYATTIKTNDEGMTSAPSGNVRVRVVRTAINGVNMWDIKNPDNPYEYAPQTVVMDKTFNTSIRAYLHEGDFIDATTPDVDWYTLARDAQLYQPVEGDNKWGWPVNMTNVTYRLFFGDGEIATTVSNTPTFKYTVDRHFDTDNHGISVASAQFDEVNTYNTRPVFKWAISEGKWNYNSYSAFRIQVLKTDIATNVYDSGLQPMPNYEEVDGLHFYIWTAPSIVGNLLTEQGQIERNGSYLWNVTVYNSKFNGSSGNAGRGTTQQPEVGYALKSANSKLTTAVNVTHDVGDHAYSTIPVTVKYAGPTSVLDFAQDLTTLIGKIRVQAFASADFSGEPVSEAIIATNNVSDTALATANGKLYGLPENGQYYLRAYIDSNGNLKKDAWESWGSAATIVNAGETTPVGIWIEDADTDDDWLPDAWEFAQAGWDDYGRWLKIKGKEVSGKFIVTPALKAAVDGATLKAGVMSEMSGAALTVFTCAATNSVNLIGTTNAVPNVEAIRQAVRSKLAIE